VKVYHRTPHGADILHGGFRDATGSYMTDREWTGVWVSDVPLDIREGAKGDDLVEVDLPEEVFAEYEWVEEGRFYREALIPAEVLNRFPRALVAEG
jgi:hypothetical protein